MDRERVECICQHARENGWNVSGALDGTLSLVSFKKDGYEIFFRSDRMFEFTVNRESGRDIIMDTREYNTWGPAHSALARYLVENAENIAAEYYA